MKILFATGNAGKAKEVGKLLQDLGIEILSLKDIPEIGEIIEDGDTYEENALKKAEEAAKRTGMITISDDSGLEVEALGGIPGIRSARFGGAITDKEKNQKLLKMMEGIPLKERNAKFVCAAAIASPNQAIKAKTFRGECHGFITNELSGEAGFGYDPIFFYPSLEKTFAQLGKEIKNRISHRAIAFAKLKEYLENSGKELIS